MQAAGTPQVKAAIQRALADESATELLIMTYPPPSLTGSDAQCIIACLRENPRLDTLTIQYYRLHYDAGLNVLRDGLPLCTAVKAVKLYRVDLTNEDLDRLRPAFHNTSVTTLDIGRSYGIHGPSGGQVLRDLLVGNKTLAKLTLTGNNISPEVAVGLGQGLADNNNRLQKLILIDCNIGNDSLANMLPADNGRINNSLTELFLCSNSIEGAEGGRLVGLLLHHFSTLKVLNIYNNPRLGALGARAMAPGLAAASHLESLDLFNCGLGNDGVKNLVPDGQVNRSLTFLRLTSNHFQGLVNGATVFALACRCTNLDRLDYSSSGDDVILSPDQQRSMDLVLDRKRLCTEASALGGSPFSDLFRFMEKAHHHEHGLSAIFLILQNDGEDYFCTAHNRAME